MNIAMIPARGGSKRIPGKNIKLFHGVPMLARSVRAALDADIFNTVMVSTDDEEIADVARTAGAEVPWLRPDNLSDDHATTMDVIEHALDFYTQATGLCCLYATAPFVRPEDLKAGLNLFNETQADYVFTATVFPFPIQRGFSLDIHGGAEMIFPEHQSTRSQDLPEVYHDAGQFYWCRPSAVTAQRPIFSPSSRPLILPRERVQDIDTPEDWAFAEKLFAIMDGTAA